MKIEVLNEARQQVGIYLSDILKQRGWTRTLLAEKSGLTREQIKWILAGERSYTIDSFLKVVRALDCYFFLSSKDGEHLNPEHMQKKMDEDQAMDH